MSGPCCEFGLWQFTMKPDIGPISDEYLDGCLARAGEFEAMIPLIRVMSEDNDGDDER